MTEDNNKKESQRSFLIKTENLHPFILKHLQGKEDLLSFRQLQGEFASFYRQLRNVKKVAKNQNFSISLSLKQQSEPNGDVGAPDSNDKSSANVTNTDDVLVVNTTKENTVAEAAINDIILKHLNVAINEIRDVCLASLLEEIQEVPLDGSYKNLLETKQKLLSDE